MQCTRQIAPDIYWVGGSDRRLALFENLFPLPDGVAYNSYLIADEKTALMDTVDTSITRQFLEAVSYTHLDVYKRQAVAGHPLSDRTGGR